MKKIVSLILCLSCFVVTANTNPLPFKINLPILVVDNPFSNSYPLDADGIFYVTQTRLRIVGDNDYTIYGLRCNLFNQTGDTSSSHYVGNVSMNDSSLFYLRDSTYKFYGLDLSQDTSFTWYFDDPTSSPAARTSSQVLTTKPLVNISNFNLDNVDTNVYRNLTYSYAHPTIQADSIIYILTSDSARIQKKVIGTSAGISFTPTEMASLPSSNTGGLFIIIYNVMPAIVNGKKYYFQNNSTAVIGILHVF